MTHGCVRQFENHRCGVRPRRVALQTPDATAGLLGVFCCFFLSEDRTDSGMLGGTKRQRELESIRITVDTSGKPKTEPREKLQNESI